MLDAVASGTENEFGILIRGMEFQVRKTSAQGMMCELTVA